MVWLSRLLLLWGLLVPSLAVWDQLRLAAVRQVVAADQELIGRRGELAARLEREDDPVALVLWWVREAVDDSLDLRRLAEVPADAAASEAATISARLAATQQRAAAIAARRPWSSAAWSGYGMASFLRAWREDPEALRTDQRWQAALEMGVAVAGADPNPKRLLALTWLERWPALRDSERELGRPAVASALADPAVLPAILPGWLALHAREGIGPALEALPDRSTTWESVAQWWRARGRMGRVVEAWQRRDMAREREARAALERAEAMLAGGAIRDARGEINSVLNLDPDARSAELFVRAARILPSGPADPARAPQLERWLEWAVELGVHGRVALPADVLARLGAAVEPTLGAAATALAGDLEGAAAIARRADQVAAGATRREWLALATAEALVARGELEQARRQLDLLPAAVRGAPEGHRLEALANGRDPAATEGAVEPHRWRHRGGRAMLEVWAPASARLELWIEGGPSAIVAITVDGAEQLHALTARRRFELELPPAGGPVLVTVAAKVGVAVPGSGRVVHPGAA